MLTIKVKSQVCMLASVRKATLICLFCCVVQKLSHQLDGATVQGGKIQIKLQVGNHGNEIFNFFSSIFHRIFKKIKGT